MLVTLQKLKMIKLKILEMFTNDQLKNITIFYEIKCSKHECKKTSTQNLSKLS